MDYFLVHGNLVLNFHCITVNHRVKFLFIVCTALLVLLVLYNKRGSVAAVDQVDLGERNNIISLTYPPSTY